MSQAILLKLVFVLGWSGFGNKI